MTARQQEMLNHMKALPARYHVHGVKTFPLRMDVLDIYDARSWRGLFQNGQLRFAAMGFEVVA